MRMIPSDELHEIIRKHNLWLQGEDGGERAILRGANLSGADLRVADLSRADLSGAILRGADLSAALCSYHDGHDTGRRGYSNAVLEAAEKWQ